MKQHVDKEDLCWLAAEQRKPGMQKWYVGTAEPNL